MRLFIAFDILCKEVLTGLQKSLKGADIQLVSDFHCTLKFLGDVSPKVADEIKTKLQRFSFEKVKANLSSLGCFPSEGNARVIWVGLEPANKIITLQKQIDSLLEKLFEKEKQFVPHVTLGRINEINDQKQFESSLKTKVPLCEFDVSKVILYESTLTREGAVHRVVTKIESEIS